MRAILLVCCACLTLSAETAVNAIFTKSMVLQRDLPIRVWGSDAPGQQVTVALAGATVTGASDDKGRWRIELPAQQAGGPHTLTISGSTTVTIEDVLIGEVWLCSGQSNMAFPLEWLRDNPDNPQTEKLPQLRLFTVGKSSGSDEQHQLKGTWQIANGDIRTWSATAFHFGRHLHQHLQVPVGLINSSVGGTPIESWMDRATIAALPELSGHVNWLNGQIADYPKQKAAFDAKLAAWEASDRSAPKPKANLHAPDSPWRPAGLYNHMIHPLVGYTLRGAVWYQGESNAGRAAVYAASLKSMITAWRTQWQLGDFPFITIQLANFKEDGPFSEKSTWALLREAQNESLTLPNTGVAVTIDVGDPKDIHPKNKKAVGDRAALIARKLAYGEDLIHSGPTPKTIAIDGANVRITFDHVGEGLRAKGDAVLGFYIAGADKAWVAATATIDGDAVVLSAQGLAAPLFVRYAWADNPVGTLANSADLPATPFRND